YQLDGGPLTPYSDDISFNRILLVPAPGPHSISIIATDLARNTATLANQVFFVHDVAAPTPPPSPPATPTPTPPTPPPTPPPPPRHSGAEHADPDPNASSDAHPGAGQHLGQRGPEHPAGLGQLPAHVHVHGDDHLQRRSVDRPVRVAQERRHAVRPIHPPV